MRRQRRDAHRDQGPFRRRQRPDGGEELRRPRTVDDAQERLAALCQP